MAMTASSTPQRDVSAIMFADVHGYSRLMGEDEDRTYARVKQSIDFIKSLIGDYGGRVMNVAGDGVLALFDTAAQSIDFAIAIQKEFRNETVWNPGEEPLAFRIGINLGDVLVGDSNIQGHSVNIAARIQALANPGGICITDRVQRDVRGIPGLKMHSMGTKRLKNIREPVEIFAIEINGEVAQPAVLPAMEPSSIELSNEASVAVLPLDNLSGDPRDGHVCDGITGDIIANLSHFRDLLVIARHSSFMFKNQNMATDMLGRQLGVQYLVTGGLQHAGNKIRIRIQLLEAETERVIWSEHYDGDLADIFAFQDDVTAVIAARLSAEINTAERHRQLAVTPPDLQAYGLILRGQELSHRVAKESNLHARRLFEQATAIDPKYARGFAGMSRSYNRAWRFNWTDPPAPALIKAVELAEQAIEVDPSDSRGHASLGSACLYRRQHDLSLAAYERAIELNPNDADVLAEMGHTVSCQGHTERAVELLKRAMRLNPYYPDWYLWHLGEAYFDMKDYDEAVRTLSRMHDKSEAFRLLTASHAHMGQLDEAKRYAAELMRTQPEFTIKHWSDVPPDLDPEPRERLIEGLKKAGLK